MYHMNKSLRKYSFSVTSNRDTTHYDMTVTDIQPMYGLVVFGVKFDESPGTYFARATVVGE